MSGKRQRRVRRAARQARREAVEAVEYGHLAAQWSNEKAWQPVTKAAQGQWAWRPRYKKGR
jgi:hypothetical protein